MASEKDSKKLKKNVPTIFPMGFAIGQVDEGNVVIIDFIDRDASELTVLGSFALTLSKAKELAAALNQEISEPSKGE